MRRYVPKAKRSHVGLVLLTMLASGLAAACGQGFDRAAAVDGLQAANPEVSEAEAGCVVDRLVERSGLDALADELSATEPDPAFTEAQFQAMFACGVEGDVAADIAAQLEASGVDPANAPCVAETLTADLDGGAIDVLLSGEITDEFMTEFTAAMEGCGAVASQSSDPPGEDIP